MPRTDETYYIDFPTKPIGGSNPYSCCSFCGISVPEINGDLRRHRDNCEYRVRKEREILNGIPFTMANIVEYIKKNLTVRVEASKAWGVEVEISLDGEVICSDTADLPTCDCDCGSRY